MNAKVKAHSLFSTVYAMRAEGGYYQPISKRGIHNIRLARKWEGKAHDGSFYGLYWRNPETNVFELCEVDGGVCYEAHRDIEDAQWELDDLRRTYGAFTEGDYEIRPIAAGVKVCDPITETVVTNAAFASDEPVNSAQHVSRALALEDARDYVGAAAAWRAAMLVEPLSKAQTAWERNWRECLEKAKVEKHVFQDGRDFYIGTKSRTEQTVTAPMQVSDFDTAAATNARDWFVKIWCAQNNVKPLFEGETF